MTGLQYLTRPLSDRTWCRPASRKTSQFTAPWSSTMELLEREYWMLDGRHLVIEVDVPERGIRNDGRLRSDARAASPAVVVAFDSKHGPLLYRCDRFVRQSWLRSAMDDWQHNVRAIAMTLESLRAVDRYAASQSGEQYRGYKALPSGTGAIATGMTTTDAAVALIRAAGLSTENVRPERSTFATSGPTILRAARSLTHPDQHNGDQGQWNLVDNASQTLTRAGWLT